MIEAIIAIGLPIVRSVEGWLRKSLKNGHIEPYEWRLLLETTIRITLINLAMFYGFKAGSMDVPMLATSCAAYIADKILKSWKEQVPKRK